MKREEISKSDNPIPGDNYSNYVKMLSSQFIPILELLFAKELPADKKEEIKKKLDRVKSASEKYSQQVEHIKETGDMVRFAEISNDFMRSIMPDTDSAVSALEYARRILFEPKQAKVVYIRSSKYDDYIRCMKEIINTAMDKDLGNVTSYMSSVEEAVTDIQSWGQSLAIDMGRIVKYLAPDRIRFSRGLALRCITEYGKMSGLYETLTKIVAGFVCIGSDKAASYNSFRRRSLAKNLSVIQEKGWSTLTREFNILIRNSIAHKSFILHPTEKVINFNDAISGKEENVSYRSLFEQTRELSCLVLALGKFMGLVDEAILMKIESFLKPRRVIE